MTGVVLCGGQSIRMGADKGLLQNGGRAWAAAAAEKLASLHLPVVFSVNKGQASVYANLFKQEQLVVDDDGLPLKGPLLGLLSVHAHFPQQNLFVLACDVKDMTATILQTLFQYATQNNGDAFVFATDEKPQPLCGIYNANGLKKVYAMLQAGTLKKFNVMHVLEALHTRYLAAKSKDLPCFKNYNSPSDL